MAKKVKKSQKRIFKLIKLIIILVIIIYAIVFISTKLNKSMNKSKKVDGKTVEIDSLSQEAELPKDISINLAVIGDIMCHNTQYQDAYENGVYDFSYVFDDIRDELQAADFTVGNLETTFAGSEKGYSSYPEFNTPESLAVALKEAGIDLVSTANNHSLDTRYFGIESTIDFLDEVGIMHTGTYKSEEEQLKTTIAEINGLKVAFLSFTYGTNGIPVPSGKEYCINLIDDDFIVERLTAAKAENPDIICVFMHWGEEYETVPNARQKQLAKLLFDNGANIILGSHPHVLQKMEKVSIANGELNEENEQELESSSKEGFVIYSLGNFVSGQVKENTRDSIILNLTITKKGSGEVVIDSAKYTPIYTYKGNTNLKRYKVLDIKRALDAFDNGNKYITDDDYNVLTKEYNKIINTVGPEITQNNEIEDNN